MSRAAKIAFRLFLVAWLVLLTPLYVVLLPIVVLAGLLLPEQGGVLPGAAEAGTAPAIGRALLSTHLWRSWR